MTATHMQTPLAHSSDLSNTVWYLGNPFTFLATGADTGDRYALIRVRTKKGQEPPPHTHTREDEAYYVLRGAITFTLGDQTLHAGPGTYVFLPRGIQHGFRIESEDMDVLMLLTPAGLENYFRHPDLSEPAQSMGFPPLPQSPYPYARSMEILPEYGVIMPPPERSSSQ